MNRYKQREDPSPLSGVAYIRFSSDMQSDSFSLDAQLRQITVPFNHSGISPVVSCGLIIAKNGGIGNKALGQ